jgi:hypothetical protein
MRFKVCFLILSFSATIFGQEVKSSVEFLDTTVNKKTGEIGWVGNAETGSFFIDANGQRRLVIKNDTTTITGQVKATSFAGDGSKLTGIAADSIAWSKIKEMPAAFADGIDNVGGGGVSADSVRAASVSDSSKKIPDGSVTNAKLAPTIKIKDENIDSVSWSKIKGVPAGFADGVDNMGESAADSVRATAIADSCKKIPDGSVTELKFSSSLKIKADSSRSAFIADTCKKYPKISKIDSAKVAQRADSLGTLPASRYALKTEIKNNTDSLGGKPAAAYATNAQADLKYANGVTWYFEPAEVSRFWLHSDHLEPYAFSITVKAPSAGFVIINATAAVYFENTASNYAVYGQIAKTSTWNASEMSYPIFGQLGLSIPFTATKGYVIPAQGDYTYYFNFKRHVASTGITGTEFWVWNPVMTATFSASKY